MYNASFDNEVIFSPEKDAVVSYIDTSVEVKLANNSQVIPGSTDGMGDAAETQGQSMSALFEMLI